jgi:UDP-N-acetylmuramoyl-tripeptide--D-alanyl-D-alanine ligase
MTEHNLNISLSKLAKIVNGSWINLSPESKNKQIKCISTDSRKNCNNALFLALSGEFFDGHKFIQPAIEQNATAVCINKNRMNTVDILSTTPILVVENTLLAYQKIATYHRLRLTNLVLIGLTGSNGKTSTKDILYSILSSEYGEDKIYATKANTNNHIGVPQNLLNLNSKHKIAIIEMGSNHPGEITILTKIAKPDIALLTSIGPSHLEFFKNLNGVAIEKREIFSSFRKNKLNCAIIPSDCPEYKTIIAGIPENIPIKTFGYKNNPELKIIYNSSSLSSNKFSLIWKNNQTKIHNIESTLPGKHQTLNAAGAALIADIIGIPKKKIVKSLKNPVITGMRMRISVHDSITWINDAYNANPASTNSGIEYLAELNKEENKKIYVILGDMLELGKNTLDEHINILRKACRLKNNAVICSLGEHIHEAANILKKRKILKFKNKNQIIEYLNINLRKGDIVYLKGSNSTGLHKIESAFEEI